MSTSKKGLRNFLWNYPVYIVRSIRFSAPLSYILLYSLVCVYIFTLVIDPAFISSFHSRPANKVVEGVVGSVDSLNPVFVTQNQVDRDIRELIFEKFIDLDKQGNPVSNIAKDWDVSDDGTVYTFRIRTDMLWHDGEPVTVDDVVFTFDTAIYLAEKYSKVTVGQILSGVTVEKLDEERVRFILDEPNATTFESLSAYIIPKHLLESASLARFESAYYSTNPVGCGPYVLVKRDDSGVLLKAFDQYIEPVGISEFEYRVYADYDALEVAFKNGDLDTVSGLNSHELDYINDYDDSYRIFDATLVQRKKILFFNNREEKFANVSLRRGLSYLFSKTKLLEETGIDGVVSHSTIPSTSWAYEDDIDYLTYSPNKKAVGEMLDGGYLKSKESGLYKSEEGEELLSFELTYLDNPLNEVLANGIKSLYEEEGIVVTLDVQSYEKITKETLATRDFEALLYEVEVTVDPDQYDLWHSLSTDYPKLNLSGYSFSRVDIALEEGRQSVKRKDRLESYSTFQKFITADAPVIVLYDPVYTYVVSNRVDGVNLEGVKFPAERFSNVYEWSIE